MFTLTRYSPNLSLGEFVGNSLAMDLYEEDDRLVAKTTLPGVNVEDIDVTVQNGFLTIRAQKEARMERNRSGWRVRAQRYGAWQRSIRLPLAVDASRADAVLKNGVLTITLPRLKPRKNLLQRIKVRAPKFKLPFFGKKQAKIKITNHSH